MKFIIIYNECLRSKIIYTNFIKKNYVNIKYLIKVPNYPKKKNKSNFFLKLFKASIHYKIYLFISIILFKWITFINKKTLENLAINYGIRTIYMKNFRKFVGFFIKRDPMGPIVSEVIPTKWQHRHRVSPENTLYTSCSSCCFRCHTSSNKNTVFPVFSLVYKWGQFFPSSAKNYR